MFDTRLRMTIEAFSKARHLHWPVIWPHALARAGLPWVCWRDRCRPAPGNVLSPPGLPHRAWLPSNFGISAHLLRCEQEQAAQLKTGDLILPDWKVHQAVDSSHTAWEEGRGQRAEGRAGGARLFVLSQTCACLFHVIIRIS
jgi:hypothetical protein